MSIKKLAKVRDAYNVGDVYDDGDVKGKIQQIITADDGTKSVVVEATNDDGDIENIEIEIADSKKISSDKTNLIDAADPDKEWDPLVRKLWNGEKISKPSHWTDDAWTEFKTSVEDFQLSDDNPEGTVMKEEGDTVWFETPWLDDFYDEDDEFEIDITDSSDKEQFYMDLIIKHKATCPVSGEWELKKDGIYNKGKKVAEVGKDVETTLKNIDKAMEKITDGTRQFTQYSIVKDEDIDELFEKGDVVINLGDMAAEDFFEQFDEVIQEYAGPDGYIDLKWKEDPYGKTIYIWVDEESTEIG